MTAIVFPLGAALLAAGATWGATTARVEAKLDTSRFVAESLRTEAKKDRLVEAIDQLRGEQQETNARLREIVCAGRVAGCR